VQVVVDESKIFKEIVVSRRDCTSSCCSGLKRESDSKDASAKKAVVRMRHMPALLRELPPRSISGLSTAVPPLLPPAEFFRIFNGSTATADAERDGCGMMFSSVAHIPYIDEVPSAWTAGRRDVNQSRFVMWDKGGTDTLFSLWNDGIRPPLLHHSITCIYNENCLPAHPVAQGCVYTATSLGAILAPPLPPVTHSAREVLLGT